LPTILSQCAFFLFTIIDGIFVGNGVGTDALSAVNLAAPLVMLIILYHNTFFCRQGGSNLAYGTSCRGNYVYCCSMDCKAFWKNGVRFEKDWFM